MSLEMRPIGSNDWYNPNRDLVSQTVQLLRQASYNMVDELLTANHAFAKLVQRNKITQADMNPAAAALAKFIVLSSDSTQCDSLEKALHESGLLELSEPVLHVTFCLIGQGLLGRFFNQMRQSALPELIVPMASKEAMVDIADAMRTMGDRSESERLNLLKDVNKWAKQAPLAKKKT